VTNGANGDTTALIKGATGIFAVGVGQSSVDNFGTILATYASATGVKLRGGGGSLVNGSSGDATALVEGDFGVYFAGAGTVTNYGTIEGTGGVSVQFKTAGDRLVAEAGSVFIGAIQGDGGTLEVAGGTGTITGLGGNGALSGGDTASFSGFKAYVIDDGGTWTIDGGTLAATQSLTLANADGILDGSTAAGSVTNAGEIVLNGGTVYLGLTGEIDNTGTLQVQNDGHLFANTAGATLSGGGQVTMSNGIILGYTAASSLTNIDNTIAGSGDLGDGRLTLINEEAGVIDATGVIFLQTSSFQNAGLLEATGSGKLDIENAAVDDTGGGTISAGAGALVLLNGADVRGGTIGGAGQIKTVGQANELDGTTGAVSVTGKIIVVDGTALTLAGTIDNTGQITLEGYSAGADLFIGAAGATLTGGGTVYANATGLNQIGADAPAILTNVNNRINGPGTLGDANLTLINEAGGIIYAGGTAALTINTGANIIQNAGLIEGYSAAGVVVKSAVDNTGNLVANGGSLTIDGAVTGTGVAHIINGTLTFGSSFDETVVFATGATSGTLVLAQSAGDTAAIYGFSTTGATSLDLQDIAFATASESYAGAAGGGILTVTDGTHTAKLKLFGNFLGSSFDLSKDAGGGVIVTDPPKTTAFTSAMASFGVSSHASAAIGAGAAATPPTRLATPAYTG